jgi:hypothetical protein
MHPVVSRSILRSFIRVNRLYEVEGIPQPAWPSSDLKSAIAGSLLSFKTATETIRGMNDRLHVLTRSGIDVRQALSEWRAVLRRRHHDPAGGIEEASILLARINARSFDGVVPGFEEGEDTSWASGDSARSVLDRWASELKQGFPKLFFPPSSHKDAVVGLVSHLFAPADTQGRARVYGHPIEWVYDGTGPLLVTEVLRRGKGAPIALAIITCLLGKRLGLGAFPIALSRPNEDMGAQDLLSDLHSIGQDVTISETLVAAARRHRGRSAYVSPPVEDWGVFFPSSHANHGPLYLDLSLSSMRKVKPQDASTILLSQSEIKARHPDVDTHPRWSLPAFSSNIVRQMMVSHQRRGESDLVSFYLYQLLALDPNASEWSEMGIGG